MQFAIKTDGTLWAWGNNEEGQLGLNSQKQQIIHHQFKYLVLIGQEFKVILCWLWLVFN